MIDDFTQGDAAEQGSEETLLPAAAVGAVEESHAEVTGQVRPLSKHRVLHTTRVLETWTPQMETKVTSKAVSVIPKVCGVLQVI